MPLYSPLLCCTSSTREYGGNDEFLRWVIKNINTSTMFPWTTCFGGSQRPYCESTLAAQQRGLCGKEYYFASHLKEPSSEADIPAKQFGCRPWTGRRPLLLDPQKTEVQVIIFLEIVMQKKKNSRYIDLLDLRLVSHYIIKLYSVKQVLKSAVVSF